ncbi:MULTISPECIES: hypothetical protein [unclassified Aureispira]|uniref:hypothetical protein n=1 Tax=unclassified Aureispira TaxID=2649989 RepID=UPI00069731A5|nr:MULTISPECIES: hypothetical protein [unclassified Aureispira]WMX14365.1 hypothetical protein QP953_26270 [Aureispira sp. CCB-E]
MNKTRLFLLLSGFCALLIGCDNTTKTTSLETIEEQTAPYTTSTSTEVPKKEQPLIIYENAFLQVFPGSPIEEHKAIIEEDLLQTGEGDFEIYNIKHNENGVVAYFLADPIDQELVGEIYITSPLAQTEDGIGLGHTFGELLDKYPNLEVHGSEIESQTFANYGNLAFRIDEPHATYDLDINAVSKEAKIIEIVIKR